MPRHIKTMTLCLSVTPISLDETRVHMTLDFTPKRVEIRTYEKIAHFDTKEINYPKGDLGIEFVMLDERKFYFTRLLPNALCIFANDTESVAYTPTAKGFTSAMLLRTHSNHILGKNLLAQFLTDMTIETFRCRNMTFLPSSYMYSLDDCDMHMSSSGILTVVSYVPAFEMDMEITMDTGLTIYVHIELFERKAPTARLKFQRTDDVNLGGTVQHSLVASKIAGSSLLWVGNENCVVSFDATPAHTTVVVKGLAVSGFHSIDFDVTEQSKEHSADTLPPIVALVTDAGMSGPVAHFLNVPIRFAPSSTFVKMTTPQQKFVDLHDVLGIPVKSKIQLMRPPCFTNSAARASFTLQSNDILEITMATRVTETVTLDFLVNDVEEYRLDVVMTAGPIEPIGTVLLGDPNVELCVDSSALFRNLDETVQIMIDDKPALRTIGSQRFIVVPPMMNSESICMQISGTESSAIDFTFRSIDWKQPQRVIRWPISTGSNVFPLPDPAIIFQLQSEPKSTYASGSSMIYDDLTIQCARNYVRVDLGAFRTVPCLRIKTSKEVIALLPGVIPQPSPPSVPFRLFGFDDLVQVCDPREGIANPTGIKYDVRLSRGPVPETKFETTNLTFENFNFTNPFIRMVPRGRGLLDTDGLRLTLTCESNIWLRSAYVTYETVPMFRNPAHIKHIFTDKNNRGAGHICDDTRVQNDVPLVRIAHRNRFYMPGESIYGSHSIVTVHSDGKYQFSVASDATGIGGNLYAIGDFFCIDAKGRLWVLTFETGSVELGPFFTSVAIDESAKLDLPLPPNVSVAGYRIIASQTSYIDSGNSLNVEWGSVTCSSTGVVRFQVKKSVFPPINIKLKTPDGTRTCQLFVHVQPPEPPAQIPVQMPPVQTRSLVPAPVPVPKLKVATYLFGTHFTDDEISDYKIGIEQAITVNGWTFVRKIQSGDLNTSILQMPTLARDVYMAYVKDASILTRALFRDVNVLACVSTSSDIEMLENVMTISRNGSDPVTRTVQVIFKRGDRVYLHEIMVHLKPQVAIGASLLTVGPGSIIIFDKIFQDRCGAEIGELRIDGNTSTDLWIRDNLASWHGHLEIRVLQNAPAEKINFSSGLSYIGSLQSAQILPVNSKDLVKRTKIPDAEPSVSQPSASPVLQPKSPDQIVLSQPSASSVPQPQPSSSSAPPFVPQPSASSSSVPRPSASSVPQPQSSASSVPQPSSQPSSLPSSAPPFVPSPPASPALAAAMARIFEQTAASASMSPDRTIFDTISPNIRQIMRLADPLPRNYSEPPRLDYHASPPLSAATRARIFAMKKQSTQQTSHVDVFLHVRYPLEGHYTWTGPINGCMPIPGGVIFLRTGIYIFRGTSDVNIHAHPNIHFNTDSTGTVALISEFANTCDSQIVRAYIFAHGEEEPKQCKVVDGKIILGNAGPGCTLICHLRNSNVRTVYLV